MVMHEEEIIRRQRARARILAWLLAAFVVLMFFHHHRQDGDELVNAKGRTAVYLVLLVFGMTGLAFASVQIYRAFCELTGFDGTPARAEKAPGAIAGQIGVRFDANVNPGLPWRFEPEQKTVRIAPGARTQVFYRATNLTARPITGQAVFNVSPTEAGKYFSKIECFCFTEQTLKAGQTADMPVIFFVDPKIRTDEDTRDIDEITLSYTFYPVETAVAAR